MVYQGPIDGVVLNKKGINNPWRSPFNLWQIIHNTLIKLALHLPPSPTAQ